MRRSGDIRLGIVVEEGDGIGRLEGRCFRVEDVGVEGDSLPLAPRSRPRGGTLNGTKLAKVWSLWRVDRGLLSSGVSGEK